ncbi:hypothetical protein BpOF4_02505 [Alkalihalophilus pseudofirmus OF4]|uniref:DUF3006 domain-containing protein n=2 Tax=Alkalihalophilus pseudofirmus TaxID=79885 RepID=D3FVQ3_ALKPO|nr:MULTISPECIES: DUF3006 domain-containing protein [Alkalihalophilus]AAZ94418.1 hypothetical protein [Alkalihalophilus pseudofirmus]ADC48568.1 hypothetical protein BpOF4_02505 [Alkalihalophilus pseudofirmus OF4]MED1600936.1 DUF3006 domain-containing protein [Alkalihalophilus marmarensis]
MIAVLDRIVDNKAAVLLVGESEKEYTIPLSDLPPDVCEGDSFEVEVNMQGEREHAPLVINKHMKKEERISESPVTDMLKQLKANQKSRFKKK